MTPLQDPVRQTVTLVTNGGNSLNLGTLVYDLSSVVDQTPANKEWQVCLFSFSISVCVLKFFTRAIIPNPFFFLNKRSQKSVLVEREREGENSHKKRMFCKKSFLGRTFNCFSRRIS